MTPVRALVVAALATLGCVGPAGAAHAATSPAHAAGAATSYLLAAENADGGFGLAPGAPSTQLYTGWAALGLASAGVDLQRVAHGTHGLVGYVRSAPGATSDVGSLERTILVLHAAGLPDRADLVGRLRRRIRADGSVGAQVNLTAFAVLALRAAGVAPGVRTLTWLAAQQDGDGGFSFATAGGGSDVDDTGAALEALSGVGAAGSVRARAIAYLRAHQDRDGGFASQPGTGSNAQSTAWAVQGLEAAGISPQSLHRNSAPSPLSYLAGLSGPAGVIRYSAGVQQTPVWVTGEALMALEGKPLPVAAPPAPARPVPNSPAAGPGRTRTASRRRGARPRQGAPVASGSARAAGTPAADAAIPGSGADRARAGARISPAAPAATGEADRLIRALGILTAVALAPVGAG